MATSAARRATGLEAEGRHVAIGGFDAEAVRAAVRVPHERNNVPASIASKVGQRLLLRPNHPLQILVKAVHEFWSPPPAYDAAVPQPRFKLFTDLSPVVTVKANFDDLLTPADHVSRQPSDTFYVDADRVLRCHTSAHQTQLLRSGERAFLVAGDVFRRDEIDATHYPVFHQMEGVRVFEPSVIPKGTPRSAAVDLVVRDLKTQLEGQARHLFGKDVQMRWVDAYFPFTEPSFELEVFFGGKWMEVLGCGMVHQTIMHNCGLGDQFGWAFGLGLERLAMRLFDIPDIRLFWTDDARFHSQFASGRRDVRFQAYSKFPPCYKDVTFWLPPPSSPRPFHANDLYELVRDVAGDLVESVECIDQFTHPKTGRTSHCYRINYRSMDRSLTNEEIDGFQFRIRDTLKTAMGLELR